MTQSNSSIARLKPKSELIDDIITHVINTDQYGLKRLYNSIYATQIQFDDVDWTDESFRLSSNCSECGKFIEPK